MEPQPDAAGKASGGPYPLTIAAAVLVALFGLAYLAFLQLTSCRITASNDAIAITSLKAYLSAQNMFHRADHYGIGKTVFANLRDGVGFPDLYAVGGPGSGSTEIKLIPITFALATPGAGKRCGYQYADIVGDADGPYDPEMECGLCAAPAEYRRSGRNVYIIDVTGAVYQRDAAEIYPGLTTGDAVPPVTIFPGPQELSTWIVVADK